MPAASDKGKLSQVIPGVRKGVLRAFLEPSLALLCQKPPSGRQWIHEIKYDGYRIRARVEGGRVRLLTRKGLDWTKRFPTIASALEKLGATSALIDGGEHWLKVKCVQRQEFKSSASGLDDSRDDEAASAAELIRQFPQAQRRLAEPEAIELHQFRFVELDREPRPEGIEIIGLAA